MTPQNELLIGTKPSSQYFPSDLKTRILERDPITVHLADGAMITYASHWQANRETPEHDGGTLHETYSGHQSCEVGPAGELKIILTTYQVTLKYSSEHRQVSHESQPEHTTIAVIHAPGTWRTVENVPAPIESHPGTLLPGGSWWAVIEYAASDKDDTRYAPVIAWETTNEESEQRLVAWLPGQPPVRADHIYRHTQTWVLNRYVNELPENAKTWSWH